jgi:hypothetical protein
MGNLKRQLCAVVEALLITCDRFLSPNAQSRSSMLITEPRVDLSNRQRSAKSSSSPRFGVWEMKRDEDSLRHEIGVHSLT